MVWTVFLIISAVCFLSFAVFSFLKAKKGYKVGRIIDPSKIFFLGVILSAIFLFVPICINAFKTTDCGVFETVLIAVHNMIKLFVLGTDFEFVTSNLVGVTPATYRAYTVFLSSIFVVAPVLTFGFVLSFFKNLSAYKRFFTHFKTDTFIFSKLDEKSISLAKSLSENNSKKRFFVFCDVFAKNDEQSFELIEQAKEIGAVCFKKDIKTINFTFHSKKSELNFFMIGEDQSENISGTLKIIADLKYRDKTNLYVFSTEPEAELLLARAFENVGDDAKIRVRRVNEVQSLISRNLYEKGFEKIFETAYEDEDGIKRINAVVVGFGKYGKEMTKALSWFCQMDGYLAEIDSFDADPEAYEKFASECPELMKYSGRLNVEGESKYTINIHSGIKAETATFDNIIYSLPKTTYAFVALGDDETNVSIAIKLRMLFARMGYEPQIQAVVYNSDKKNALKNISNFKGQKYDIDFIGDRLDSYSEKVILGSDIEKIALERHLKWGSERDFWQYSYNYKSSVASAIHSKMKKLCGIKGIEKAPQERTEQELWSIRILEHCRWNAYMRSEGYVYGGTVENSGRYDLAKTHNCLVPFADLPLKEQEKDDD